MTLQILYQEQKSGTDTDEEVDLVRVELRLWSNDERGYMLRTDLVLDCQVLVDGKFVVNEARILAGERRTRLDDHQAIRLAISKFDDLFSTHPHKDKMTW